MNYGWQHHGYLLVAVLAVLLAGWLIYQGW